MKQIFDWMRGQIEKERYLPSCIRIERDFDDGLIRARDIINEAESKWEADCCEWKRILINTYLAPTCVGGKYFEYDDMKFCPYCGKPIKIVEVE